MFQRQENILKNVGKQIFCQDHQTYSKCIPTQIYRKKYAKNPRIVYYFSSSFEVWMRAHSNG